MRRNDYRTLGKSLALTLVSLVCLGNVIIANAEPLSGDALDMVLVDSVWYEKNQELLSCLASGASIPNGSSEQNGKAIFDFLTQPGRLTPVQAAAIIGNMMLESGLLPQRLQGTPGTKITTAEEYLQSRSSAGWGLVQWTPGDKFINAIDPATKQPAHTVADANNLGVQIAFVWDQLEGKTSIPEKRAGDDLKAQTDLREAVLAFQGNKSVGGSYYGYERPKDQAGSVSVRLRYAVDALAKYGSVPSATAESSGNPCGSGGQTGYMNGNYSLPVDKKWFDQHPEWFSKPHHLHSDGSPDVASDIPVPLGQPVYSITDGEVILAPTNDRYTAYGLGVKIKVSDNIVIIYGHGSDGGSVPGAKQGDKVKAGQLIMHSASTGHSTGPHLHVEIRVSGTDRCPQPLLMAIGNGTTVPDINQLPTAGCSGGARI